MIGQSISHYRIVEKLGEGGMGVVYKAEDTKLDRPVALKFLASHLLHDEEAKARFLREAKAAAALHHANICPVYEVDKADGKTFISMAFIEGETLEERIAKGPLPIKDALHAGQQIAKGLQVAHEKGIVHRDIKPANVLVAQDGQVTIMDFGLARLVEASRLTKKDTALGTVAYMSPEQAQGAEVDHRSDVWALGCVLYEMIAGLRAFKGDYDQALLYEIVNQEPDPLTSVRAGVPMELEFIVGKCLAKDEKDRYQHADELDVDLRTLADKLKSGRSTVLAASRAPGQPGAVHQATALQRAGTAPRGAGRFVTPLAIVAAVIFFSLWMMERMRPAPERPVRRFVLAPELAGGAGFTSRLGWEARRGELERQRGGGLPWRFEENAALSPDGRHVVYRSDEIPPRLWVWSLADATPRPLPGTENARRPFWSPDSEHLGFVDADGSAIKRTTLTSAEPSLICSLLDLRTAAAWSPDGSTVVFTSGANPIEFFRVPAGGGEPEQLEIQATDNLRGVVSGLSFLPTPSRPALLLSASGSVTGAMAGAFLLDLSSSELRRLSDDPSVRYSPSGHLLSADSEGGLWAQSFSLETLEPTGDRLRVATGLSASSVSGDGTLLAIEDQGALQRLVRPDTELVLRDRAGNRIERIGPPLVGAYNPVVSPDGRRVLVAARRAPADDQEIWLLELGRNTLGRITSWPGDDDSPNWHPDGKQIVFRHDTGDGAADLFLTIVDGLAAPVPILETPGREAEPAWSPDGETLIYMSRPFAGSGAFDLHIGKRKPGGEFESSVFLATEFNEAHPQYSPDGAYLAFLNASSGRSELYVRAVSDAAKMWQVSEQGGLAPRWSRDGRELFWVSPLTSPPKLMRAAVDFDQPAAPISGIEALFDYRPSLRGTFFYDVTPDGRFVIAEPVEDPPDAPTDEPPPRMVVIENWYEELRGREQE